jgi:hypothetical protein
MGSEFLGRSTSQGSVLYLALEEKESEVGRHFVDLGLPENSPIIVHCGGIGQQDQALDALEAMIDQCGDVSLVIIDPLFCFVRVKDANDYIAVYPAMGKLMDLARKSGAAIVVIHHLKKRESEDFMDGALGSTAIVGAADTFIALKSRGDSRSVMTRQRYGVSMAETNLLWNAEERRMTMGQTSYLAQENHQAAVSRRIQGSIVDFVSTHRNCTQEHIFASVVGKTAQKKDVLATLVRDGAVSISGSGRRGDPYTYCPQPSVGQQRSADAENIGEVGTGTVVSETSVATTQY